MNYLGTVNRFGANDTECHIPDTGTVLLYFCQVSVIQQNLTKNRIANEHKFS